jgi:LysM repeat protein
MGKRIIEIDERVYLRAAARAVEEGKDLTRIVEESLRTWLGPEVPTEDGAPAEPTPTREEIYVVQYRDTLAKIALRMYGNAKQYVLIAEHNGITDPTKIRVGQQLRIPFFEEAPGEAEGEEAEPTGQPFRFPLDKTDTDYYKFGSLYGSSSRWAGKPHPGVDFHEKKGANVYAIGAGTVLVNRQDATGYGHYIMVEHSLTSGDKVYSLYGHLMPDADGFQSPAVGTKLKGKDIIIGKEGESGYAGVPHLHFETKKTAELGLYATITTYNLDEYFYDPYTFIQDPNNRCAPV